MSTTSDEAAQPWTIARLLTWTQSFLAQRQIESPRLCAELLLAHALSCKRLELFTRFEHTPDEQARGRFRELVRKAADGAPIAYLTGVKDFFSLTIEVTPAALIPRAETEVLVERTIQLVRQSPADRPPHILDLCTGSGCIAVALAKNLPAAQLFASDLSEGALEVAARNAQRHGVGNRIRLRAGDLFEPWADDQFDLIVSNPPYLAPDEKPSLPRDVREYEPPLALFAGADGLDFYRRLAADAPAHLQPGGWLLAEMGYRQSPAVRELFTEAGWRELTTFQDGLQHDRVIRVRSPA